MYGKIKNILVFSITFLSLAIFVFFLYSIYVKYFPNEGNNFEENKTKFRPEFSGTIKIFNATNVNGLAKEMKLFLKSFEIEVSSTQNYDSLLTQTKLISKPNSIELARYIAKLIDFELSRIEYSNSLENDIILVIGADYKFLKPFKN